MIKEFFFALAFFLVFLFLCFLFLYGNISPINNVSGCYLARTENFLDKVCLYESGEYEQFHFAEKGLKKKYNKSTWTSFPYSNDEGQFIAVTLKAYVRTDISGQFVSMSDLDIQPHKNTFGRVLFSIGGNASRDRTNYFLDGRTLE